jgi:NADH/NAD ratio-sensing transcriptional regulator Rex
MGGLTKSRAKLYLEGLLKAKKKHINTYELAQSVGILEDFIRDELSFIEPMVRLDLDFNLMQLVPQLESMLSLKVELKRVRTKSSGVSYLSIADFVYKNMTVSGGIIDRNLELDNQQLKDLKKLINKTIKHRSNKSKEVK